MAYKTKYSPQNPQKYIGNPNNIICRSLWERRVCRFLDENTKIIRWGSEELYVPYYSPVDRKNHKYYPDFILEKADESGEVLTLVVEVKPEKQTKPPKQPKKKTRNYLRECMTYETNMAKWKAAKEYCEKKDWEFIVITELDIFSK